jgi:hypothetical protein
MQTGLVAVAEVVEVVGMLMLRLEELPTGMESVSEVALGSTEELLII